MDIAALTAAQSGATDSALAKKSLSENFDQFLTMLTVQLQNQDPLSPMESTEFTNQLVMFSQLEQEIQSNEHLENVIALQQAAETTQALSYLGKSIKAESSVVALTDGQAEFAYDMPAGAETASITVFDQEGNIVTILPAETAAGHHSATWDGENGQGVLQSDGIYSVLVSAVDADDTPIQPITVYFTGKATGVTQLSGETLIQVGPVDVPLNAVVSTVTLDETPES